MFRCILLEDSTHRSSGFLVKIIVYSENSDLWTQKLFDILKEKGTKPTKISKTISNDPILIKKEKSTKISN